MSESSEEYDWGKGEIFPVDNSLTRLDDENRAVILHYHKLRSIIAENTTKMKNEHSKKDFESVFHQIEKATEGIGRYLSYQLKPNYYNKVRADDSETATTTFCIPEILELVLQHVNHRDLLTMTQLHYQPVDASKAKEGDHGTMFRYGEREGFSVDTREYNDLMVPMSYDRLPGQEQFVDARFLVSEGRGLPMIGSSWKRMLICQPPVKLMEMSTVCSRHYVRLQEGVHIASETGLTVGDLYEHAQKTLADPPTCPYPLMLEEVDGDERPHFDIPCEITQVEFATLDPDRDHSQEGD